MSREESAQHVPVRVAASAVAEDDQYYAPAESIDGEGRNSAENPFLLVHSLLRGRYLVSAILAVIAGALGCAAGWFATKPTFQSVGVIQIKPNIPNVVRDKEGMIPMFDAYVESQMAIIRSDSVLSSAMMAPEWRSRGRGMSPTAVEEFSAALTVTHPPRSQLIEVAFTDRDPNAAQVAARLVTDNYLKLFDNRTVEDGNTLLKVVEDRISNKRIQIKDFEDRIGQITKDVGAPYIEKIVEGKIRERQELGEKLNALYLQLVTAKALKRDPSGDAKADSANAPTTQSVVAPLPRSPSPPVEVLAAREPMLRDLLHQRSELEISLIAMRNRLGDKHNRVIEVQEQLDRVNHRIDDVAAVLQAAEATGNAGMAAVSGDRTAVADVDILLLQEKVLKSQYVAAEKAIHDLGGQGINLENLHREKASAEADLDEAKRRRDDLALSASITGRASSLGVPDVPVKPLKDKRAALAAAGGLFGAGLAVGSVLLFGFANRKLRHIADAHSGLCRSVPLLGILPELPKDLSDPDQTAIAVHSVHKIRAMLQLAAGPQDGCKAFAITSPAAGDGKTSLTLALGLSFAACGARTLLVDFDLVGNGLTRRASRMIRPKLGSILRRLRLVSSEQLRLALSEAARDQLPLGKVLLAMGLIDSEQLSKALQVQKESLVGLLDVIAGEPLDECVSGADVNGLFILPVGSARAAHVGRLSPRAVRAILEEARKEFDVVLVDTGPVLGSLEASILAPAVDGVVLTVSRGEQQMLARRSMDHLISTGGRVLGVVFNRARNYDVLSSRFSSSTSIRLLSRPDQLSSEPSEGEDALSARLGPVGSAVNAAEAASRVH